MTLSKTPQKINCILYNSKETLPYLER